MCYYEEVQIITPNHMKRLLVVDDDPYVRKAYLLKLEAAGFKVDAAVDGIEGWKMLSENPSYDTVILDLIMPGMTGIEVLEHMRQEDKTKKTPVLVMTNSLRGLDPDALEKLDVAQIIIKTKTSIGAIVGIVEVLLGDTFTPKT